MHKKLLIMLVLLLALGLAACAETSDAMQPAAEPAKTDAPVSAIEAPKEDTAEPEAEPTALVGDADLRTFTIAPDHSEVRFVIDEVLRGNPVTVVGVNSGVSGEVAVDVDNPANTQIGTIDVDAAGFITDEDRRNSAIQRFILQTGQYPVVTFRPTEISALPESAAVGDSFDFQVTGDLTILDTTNPVTFDVTTDVISENELYVTGASTINRADFGISIPSVPFVASAGEELALQLDLVAVAD